MKPIPVVVACVAVLGVGGFFWTRAHAGKAESLTQYKVAKVDRGNVRKTVSASGTLQPWTTVDVKSKAGGRIDVLAVDVGTRVKPGQIIAKIDPTDSQLTFSQAKADTDSAEAKQQQSGVTYAMQIDQTKASVEQAQANLDSAQSNLLQVQARYQSADTENHAQPALTAAAINQARANYDAAVQNRNKLNATQIQDRASAQAAYDEALANDRNAQTILARQKSLLAKGYVSQATADQAEANAGSTHAQVQTAKAKLDTMQNQQRAERDASDAAVQQADAAYQTAKTQAYSIDTHKNTLAEQKAAVKQAQAQVEQARAQYDQALAERRNTTLKALDISSSRASTARAQASLTNAKATLDQTTVRAPSAGVVLTKYVEQGTIITSGLSMTSSGTSIVQLGDISRMYVDVAVDETDIASVRMNQSVQIAFDAFPGATFKGKVSKINPQAVVESNVTTVHVRVEVDNTVKGFEQLKPAMNATCEFVVGEAENVLSISTDAIHSEGDATYVEVATGGKPAPVSKGIPADPSTLVEAAIERRTVTLGVAGNDATEVKSGLTEGEMVVVQTVEPEAAKTTTQGAAAFGGPPPMGGRGGTKK